MAVSSSRSPSPITARPNANSRTPEVNNPIRRSFNGNPLTKPSIISNPRSFNPITPANSPSDFGRRNSIDKGVVSFREYEQKENEKDNNLKPVRVKSPAVSKGTKNFMSPTISAASKITAASPRKKVLAERNESVRTSVSFSDGKSLHCSVNLSGDAEDTDSKSEMGSNQKKIEALFDTTKSADSDRNEASLEATLIPKASENNAGLNSKVPSNSHESELVSTVTAEPECSNGNSSFKISPSPSCSSCPILSPLDLDPSSLPPYDPKKNFLSPRPQFLHYKPNPRIEVYLNKDGGFDSRKATCLEESFISESFSGSENTEETQSEDSHKESEDTSSVELLKEEEEEEEEGEEEEEPHDSEPYLKSTDLCKETVKAKGLSKPSHFLSRSKSISLLLILVIACLSISVTDSPVIGPSVFKDQTLSKIYNPSEFSEFAKANFDGLARNCRLWSANSISYLSKLFPLVPGELNKLGSLQFYNLTASSVDLTVDGYSAADISSKGAEEISQQNVLGPVGEEGEDEIESLADIGTDDKIEEASKGYNAPEFDEQLHTEIETDDNAEEASEEHESLEVKEQVHLNSEAEVMERGNSEAEEIMNRSDVALHIESKPESSNIDFNDQSATVSQPSYIQLEEVFETKEFQGENDLNSWAKAESIKAEVNSENSELDVSYGNSQNLETMELQLNGSEDKVSAQNMLGISLLVLTLIAATAFIYAKRERNSNPNVAIPINQLPEKKLISSPITASIEHTYQQRLSSQNWPTEFDLVGDSCPSEMSSFQKSSSYSKKGTNEVQSHERKPSKNSKRESLASSSDYSMSSPSYGSFTTYERIHRKHGGEEETATPVRRSSRIRNHFTSP